MVGSPGSEPAPFDGEFQKGLLRILMEDNGFAALVTPHLQPTFFMDQTLGWMYGFGVRYFEEYQAWPTATVYHNQIRQYLDPKLKPLYQAVVEQVAQMSLRDEQWMRDTTLDFVKRNIFVRTYQESRHLYNSGKVEEAYDLMMARMEQISRTTWDPVDESDLFSELAYRTNRRMDYDLGKDSVGTAIPMFDHILGGGLSKGELGIIIAYPKMGKSTWLVHFGVAATRNNFKKTAHFVFEGTRQMVEDRYDAALMNELFNNVKRGDVELKKYNQAWDLYQTLKGFLKIRGYTERWDYTVLDIHEDLKRWKRESGWEPDLVVVDYGDLIGGRERNYPNEREKQKAAFRDLKSLANRGYALWTASQAQRPKEGAEAKTDILRARQIADCYEKVRVADLLCSQNMTLDERKACLSRLYVELYRSNAAEENILCVCDFSRMKIQQWDATLGYPLLPNPENVAQQQASVPNPQMGAPV